MVFDPRTLLGSSWTESGSRSTVLQPLGWFIGISFSASVALFSVHAPIWAGAAALGLAGLGAIVYLGAYGYFAVTDKDSLRSEKYGIQKMAIQRGIVGDDLGYVIEESPTTFGSHALQQLPKNGGAELPRSSGESDAP
ncbi:hypothetical protein PIN31115_02833 [Pandoraea iniqua]|uniref:Uncharacterized protein n=1 Tax=Pandoraea iniqua TaxID=2508288 RepID=A0A5E4VVW8_9BURK|nr:hypothetical protein [Pandoraea iniqua]VVE15125.1 hypothetical protein PIN31115_02833 [Pandoraea iniqua]